MFIKPNQNPLTGVVKVPGDKSISHRIIMVAALSYKMIKIYNLSHGLDVLCTINALINAGISIQKFKDYYSVVGKGSRNFSFKNREIDLGNSGTSARILMGLFASCDEKITFTGDDSLSKRPMKRVTTPLEMMGVKIETIDGCLPATLQGNSNLIAINYEMPMLSAQVKSAIIFAALNAKGTTKISEAKKTRDHTERMLKYFGASIEINENYIEIKGEKNQNLGADLDDVHYHVPSDPSSAAFLTVAALITPGSHIIIQDVCVNNSRIGIYKILKKMGAKIEFLNLRFRHNEDIADIEVKYSKLVGVHVPAYYASDLIDEYPILAVAAAKAAGSSRFEGLEELKYKESNRILSIYNQLKNFGVDVQIGDDWLEITGGKENIPKGVINSYGDHRIAMSFIILALTHKDIFEIDDIECINTSFPEFSNILKLQKIIF